VISPRQRRRFSTALNQTEWFDRGQAYQPRLPFHSGCPGIYLEKIPAGKPAFGFCSFKELRKEYHREIPRLPIVVTTFFTCGKFILYIFSNNTPVLRVLTTV